MTPFAVGYRYFAGGDTFADIVSRHPAVQEVYFPWVEEPSGRPKLGYGDEDDPMVIQDALHEDLVRLRSMGIKLDLLLNANCYGEKAMSRKLEVHVIEIVKRLGDWNCFPEIVTAASPFVARTVKMNFPGIEVRASVNMRLSTVQAFDYLAPLFDSYYLCRDVQRNLETVRRFSDWCHAHGKKLCILANSGCLRNCPWQSFHDNLIAHSDLAMQEDNVRGWNPHLCWTLYQDAKRFPDILKSTWIRPEDIHHYAGMVDVVKLATRQHDNPNMVIDAYERCKFEGNLLDLLEPGFSPAFRPLYIDNAAFPLDWFEKTSGCDRECTGCDYCEQLFKGELKKRVDG